MKTYDRYIRGKRSKVAGDIWERYIISACEYYKSKELAYIEKTPEPFHITEKDINGVVKGYYEKKGQPDFKGILCDGSGIMFEAKHTDSDRINQSVVTDKQWESLDAYERYGAHCFVMVSFELQRFYRIPWNVWKNMKEIYNHKYMSEENAKEYKLKDKNGIVLILEGVELNENKQK